MNVNVKKRILVDEVYGILNFLDAKKETNEFESTVKK